MAALSESSPYMRAQANLAELKLDGMCAAMPDYVRMVGDGERDFAQAIAEMTESEVAARRERIMRQRIRSSGFPYVKTLADFDWSFQPSVPRAKVEELATLRFVDDAENALFVGSPGVGKTHLAIAIGVEEYDFRSEPTAILDRADQKLYMGKVNGRDPERVALIAEEFADVMMYGLQLARTLGIDITGQVLRKIDIVDRRPPKPYNPKR